MKTAKSLAVLQGGIRIGSASLADFTENEKGIKIKTHDGDTVNVRLADRFGLRFLGIDTPEVSMMLPGETRFKSLSNVGWDTLFTSGNWKKGMNLSSALLADLEKRAGDGTGVAANHARYARKAKISLEEIISEDIRASGVSAEKFGLFMSFGLEFLDGYGRLLCYLNSARENFSDPVTARAVTRWSYNERQLLAGWALPYFSIHAPSTKKMPVPTVSGKLSAQQENCRMHAVMSRRHACRDPVSITPTIRSGLCPSNCDSSVGVKRPTAM